MRGYMVKSDFLLNIIAQLVQDMYWGVNGRNAWLVQNKIKLG